MDEDKKNKELISIIANLESKIDLLESEIEHLNELLIKFGFSKGVEGLKESIREILRAENNSLSAEEKDDE